MMLCYSKTWKIQYFLDPPPKKKKAEGYEWSRYIICLHEQVFVYISSP